MAEIICRPFITLKNGKVLYAFERGLKAFCFEVEKVRPAIKKEAIVSDSDQESNG